MKHWADLLGHIHTVAPEAHIAGGAVRDTLLNQPVKDIDIFIHEDHALKVGEVLWGLGYGMGCTTPGQYLGGADPVVVEASDFPPPVDQEHPVNLVSLRGEASIHVSLERIDFGLCRIGYDGRKIHQDSAGSYSVDATCHRLTLLRCENQAQFDRSMKRFERLREKYVGWELVVPEQFQQYMLPGLLAA